MADRLLIFMHIDRIICETPSWELFSIIYNNNREVSDQHENDNDNEHVIILWVRASKS
jgi:hypothetical protein